MARVIVSTNLNLAEQRAVVRWLGEPRPIPLDARIRVLGRLAFYPVCIDEGPVADLWFRWRKTLLRRPRLRWVPRTA